MNGSNEPNSSHTAARHAEVVESAGALTETEIPRAGQK